MEGIKKPEKYKEPKVWQTKGHVNRFSVCLEKNGKIYHFEKRFMQFGVRSWRLIALSGRISNFDLQKVKTKISLKNFDIPGMTEYKRELENIANKSEVERLKKFIPRGAFEHQKKCEEAGACEPYQPEPDNSNK